MFTQDIILGNNLKSKSELRSATIREHLDALNDLFTERGYDPPVDFNLKTEGSALFYENVKTWERVPNRRTHFTPEFLNELIRRGQQDADGLGFAASIMDWSLLGRFTGHRLGEFAQENQVDISYHNAPRNRRFLKASSRSCFVFKDRRGRRIKDPVKNKHNIYAVTITWLVQKNRRNGQKITWLVTGTRLCPVMAALRIYDRSIRLGLKENEPMGAFFEKKKRRWLTGARIRTHFHSIAKHVYPDITKDELSQFSAHMIRVSAAVLLQVADKPGHFIQKRLRWEGDSYRVYLRNSDALAKAHNSAAADSESIEFSISPENLNIDPAFDHPIPAPLSIEEAGVWSGQAQD